MKTKVEIDIGKAVLEAYLETGEPIALDELAPRLGVSVSTLRKRINDDHAFVKGCGWTDIVRTYRNKNYPGMVEDHSKVVKALTPLKEVLRQEIQTLRREVLKTQAIVREEDQWKLRKIK